MRCGYAEQNTFYETCQTIWWETGAEAVDMAAAARAARSSALGMCAWRVMDADGGPCISIACWAS